MPCPCRYFIVLYKLTFVTVCYFNSCCVNFFLGAVGTVKRGVGELCPLLIFNPLLVRVTERRGGGGEGHFFYSVGLCVLLFPRPNPLTTNKITRIDVCFLFMFFTNFLPTKHFSSFMFRMFAYITRQWIILTPHIFPNKS